MRSEPRRVLPAPAVERIVHTAFPHSRVLASEPLGDGLRNSNLKLHLDTRPEAIVLRIYEHDPSLCRKELDLLRLVREAVPVAEVLHAEPLGLAEVPPFALLGYVEGVSFRDLARSGDKSAIAQAAYSIGETLAAISRFSFPQPGWLGPGPAVTKPLLEGVDPMPRFVDLCLASKNLQRRMPEEWRERTQALVWSWRSQLASLERDPRLVHGDFNRRNLLLRPGGGRWRVAAVLDWEFAVSASPLADVANFLRYERVSRPLAEPHFSTGYLHSAGRLPEDWRRLARIVDLTAMCESLTHDELRETVVAELVELVRAAVENRDPQ